MTANKVERRNHDKILPEVGYSIAFLYCLLQAVRQHGADTISIKEKFRIS